MVNKVLRTSAEWMEHLFDSKKVIIMDADGWDRTNYDYSFNVEKISLDEFKHRVSLSTMCIRDMQAFRDAFDGCN